MLLREEGSDETTGGKKWNWDSISLALFINFARVVVVESELGLG